MKSKISSRINSLSSLMVGFIIFGDRERKNFLQGYSNREQRKPKQTHEKKKQQKQIQKQTNHTQTNKQKQKQTNNH